MAKVRWENAMSVGVSEIDVDHRQLVEIVNRLHDALTARDSREVIMATIESLLDYTRDHFRHEEEAMRALDYPRAQSHEQEHRDLLGRLLAFKERAAQGAPLTIEIMDFLGGWLTNHMLDADKDLGGFLRARNAA